MIAGARVEVAPYKTRPDGFRAVEAVEAGRAGWPSPWGIAGRPGWHIECSAMSWKHLGETFDIHGGGIDLIFPHHENEIAQSRCAHAPVMANYWMHNGFLQVEGEKMSKSLGNFVTIRELLKPDAGRSPLGGEVIRLDMLRTHYRQPLDWTQTGLHHLLITYSSFRQVVVTATRSEARISEAVLAALADDLNTPAAMTELHRLAARARSTSSDDLPADAAAELVGSLLLLGFDRAVDRRQE